MLNSPGKGKLDEGGSNGRGEEELQARGIAEGSTDRFDNCLKVEGRGVSMFRNNGSIKPRDQWSGN